MYPFGTYRISEQRNTSPHIILQWRVHNIDEPFIRILNAAQESKHVGTPTLIFGQELAGRGLDYSRTVAIGSRHAVLHSWVVPAIGHESDNINLKCEALAHIMLILDCHSNRFSSSY